MKLNFRDLKQQKFVIEAEPSETIADVKAKIEKEKGWEVATQKLIYSGKMLQDANTIESYNIEEKGFLVCMTTKPKKPVAASSSKDAPSTPAPAPAATPSTPAAPAPASTSTTTTMPATPSPAPAAPIQSPRSLTDTNAMAWGEERAAAIANMESMGFQRADIEAAMRAAFFNPDRAVEYLLSGIPEHLQRERQAPAPAQQAAAASPAAAPAAGSPPAAEDPEGDEPINLFEAAAQAGQQGRGGAGSRGTAAGTGAGAGAGSGAGALPNLDFLRTNPQFQQLRQLVQQQPQMLEPILQQVGAGNPQLAQLISQRPEEFFALLAEDGEGDAALPPGAQAISVTEEERDAIERLCRLGFDRNLVIQAYFACDKNEEWAANFLFDHEEDDPSQ